jgi:hypothetical protein
MNACLSPFLPLPQPHHPLTPPNPTPAATTITPSPTTFYFSHPFSPNSTGSSFTQSCLTSNSSFTKHGISPFFHNALSQFPNTTNNNTNNTNNMNNTDPHSTSINNSSTPFSALFLILQLPLLELIQHHHLH